MQIRRIMRCASKSKQTGEWEIAAVCVGISVLISSAASWFFLSYYIRHKHTNFDKNRTANWRSGISLAYYNIASRMRCVMRDTTLHKRQGQCERKRRNLWAAAACECFVGRALNPLVQVRPLRAPPFSPALPQLLTRSWEQNNFSNNSKRLRVKYSTFTPAERAQAENANYCNRKAHVEFNSNNFPNSCIPLSFHTDDRTRHLIKNAMRVDKIMWTDLYFVRICAQVFSLLQCDRFAISSPLGISVSSLYLKERSTHKKCHLFPWNNAYS
jgi:hypothetical protein